MINEIYTVDILVNDKPIRKYPHNGKLFVEARKGDSYSIRIKNNSYSRVLAVTSADGLDTLTGKSATENGNGYVINGYNSLTIDGFRVSDEKVARFVFDQKNSSYAASKEDGSERNVGVIGIRLFTETTIRNIRHIRHIHSILTPRGILPPFWAMKSATAPTPTQPPVQPVAVAYTSTALWVRQVPVTRQWISAIVNHSVSTPRP